MLKQIAEGHFRDPLMVKPQIGARLQAILLRCLRIDPSQRYGSADELVTDLLAFVAEAGIDDPSKLLVEYLKDPEGFSTSFRTRIIEVQTQLGERALKEGALPRAMDAFNRVLAYDERNARVLSAVQRVGRRYQLLKAMRWASAVAAVAVIAALGFALSPSDGRSALPVPPAAPLLPATPSPTVVTEPPSKVATLRERPSTPSRPEAPAPLPPPSRPERRPSAAPQTTAPVANPRSTGTEPRHVVLDPEPANVAISIDGALPRDFGPSFRELDLAPGEHTFKFVGAHECCVNEEIRVRIPPGPGTTVVSHRLKFRPAGLYVVSNVPADVVVGDGEVSGRTRSVIQVRQPRSMFETHEIRVRAPGYAEVVKGVRLRAGQVETIQVTLAKEPAPPG